MDKIPLYNIVVDLDDDTEYMSAISFVESPAVEYQFITFDKEKPQLKFSVDNELEHKVTSVVCLCDVPIYRYSPDMGEFYVKFDKTAIDNMIYKYSKLGLNNMVNLQHDENNFVDGCTMVEMYQVNRAKGIVHKDFPDVPDYSLMATFKIDNQQVWDDIISGKCNGYSLELYSSIEPTNTYIETELSKQEPEEENINSFIEDLYNYLIGEGIDNSDIEILFADSKKKLNEIIENAIDNETKVNIGLKGESKTVQGFIYTTNDNILSLYDERKDTWHIIQKNTIKSINTVNTNIVVNWDKAMSNPDFQKILDIVRENPNPQPKATVGNDIIEQAIIEKKVVMVKYDDQTEFNCKTFRQGYILTKIINRKGNFCLRFFENSGSTHSAEENPLPSWRTLRIDRLVEIKFAPDIFKPLTVPPNGWNSTTSVERDGAVVLLKSQF